MDLTYKEQAIKLVTALFDEIEILRNKVKSLESRPGLHQELDRSRAASGL
jgi:hypothetical protein